MLDYAQPLDPGGLVREQALSYLPPSALPCCSLVAMWALAVIGRFPADAADGRISLGSWAAVDRDWWAAANVWHPEAKWSALIAHQELLGGRLALDLSGDYCPFLVPGSWQVWQRWSKGYKNGHTFLTFGRADGSFRLIQSSKARGYRDQERPKWEPRAGDMHCALTLSRL
jgi:hypothetical protein